jgi:hypothetical protein
MVILCNGLRPAVVHEAIPFHFMGERGRINASVSGRTSMMLTGMSYTGRELKPECVIAG